MKLFVCLTFLLLYSPGLIFSQEINISGYLKKIETGEVKSVSEALVTLKQKYPSHPSIIFLDALLTEQGDAAFLKYQIIYDKYPESAYADAAMYRNYSYFFALGYYKRAEDLRGRLISTYPDSPYIQFTDPDIPSSDAGKEFFPGELPADSVKSAELPETETPLMNLSIQAGAFLDIQNAKRLASDINKSGYKTEIFPKEVGGSILNVVMMGEFLQMEEAEQALEFLSKTFNLQGRIINIRKSE